MPKESRKKSLHSPSAKVSRKTVDAAKELSDIVPIESVPQENGKRAKHEALVKRISDSYSGYSKSHTRRLKRKAKEQLVGDMNDLGDVLQTMDDSAAEADATTSSNDPQSHTTARRPASNPNLIGHGKSSTLSKTQRKKELEREKVRHPLILSNPQFSTNPFETIRTHARNTLITHSTEQ